MTTLTDEQKAGARARQAKRYRDEAAAKQYNEREHIRGEIPTRRLVRDILTIGNMLQAGSEMRQTVSGELIIEQLDSTRQTGLKAAADIKFKLLNKTVPDLKQIELRADVTEEALPQHITYTVIRPEMLDEDD